MIDFHAHSNMSYCADADMTPRFYSDFLARPENKHIEKIIIADHGMALYFPSDIAWKWDFISDSGIFDKWRDWGNERLEKHLNEITALEPSGVVTGVEVEMMNDGRFTLEPSFRKNIKILIGGVHFLPVSIENGFSEKEVLEFWKDHTIKLLSADIDILAHPFRWLSKQIEIPSALVTEIVDAAHQRGKAIEINSHFKINTDAQMLRDAVARGVTVSFGTDTHSAKQAGDFSYHLDIVKAAGLKLSDIKFLNL